MLITRSLLSTPGNQARMLEKASTYGADALMFDLEDSVPPDQKAAARALVRKRIETLGDAAPVYVRVNGPTTGLQEGDLHAVVSPGLHGIVVPKSESADAVRETDALLTHLESRAGIASGRVEIALALESAAGIWFAYELLSASPRSRTVMLGSAEGGDLQTDLHASWSGTGLELLYARSRVVTAARALRIENILDGAYSNAKDIAGFVADSEMSRRLGYRGRMVIHPDQVAEANRVFAPTDQDIAFSERVVAAFESAEATERGALAIDGVMVDQAMLRRARTLLAEARRGE